jgi:hypothetical protein
MAPAAHLFLELPRDGALSGQRPFGVVGMHRQRAGALGGGGVFGHAIGDGALGQDHLAAEVRMRRSFSSLAMDFGT